VKDRAPGKDRFGLTPLPKTWYRGQIYKPVRSTVTTPIGELVTWEFDLIGEEGQPPLPIEFVGYTFSKEIRENVVVETHIGPEFPSGRLRRDRFILSFDPPNELRAYMPVERQFGKIGKDLRITILAVVGPIVVVCGLTWLFGHVLHVY
jgi:hypothetical protein